MRIERIDRLPRTRRHEIGAGGDVVLTLSTDTLQLAGLQVGDELTEGDVARLRYQDDRSRALTRALAAIARRPHSEAELRDTLRRKGFGRVLIDEVLGRMRELGYVNDAAFAEFWMETRQAAAPRSRRMLRWELARKGISTEVTQTVVEPLDDGDSAYRIGMRRARALDRGDEAAYRRRLASFLQRRGFSWEVTRRAVERCWAEDQPPP
ncbi:MAG: regulatory protein RecX [Dehalococcoidia bacterium]|nr:regulatory protein RecX [Dehalococcoidia bacterium]